MIPFNLFSGNSENAYATIFHFMVCFRVTDIQEKAVMGMNIIPSVFLDKMKEMETSDMVQIFDFFLDDIPHPGSFEAELLQWQVSQDV